MIQLERDRTKIPPGFRGATLRTRQIELLKRHLSGQEPRKSVWKSAKDQLKAESHGKCAYCEADTAVVAYGDVEHFRPASVYWWLAYCYDNYTFACQICNQGNKLARFPIVGPALQEPTIPINPSDDQLAEVAATISPDPTVPAAVQAFLAANAAEQAGLPDPYTMDPESYFIWYIDEALGEVEVRARPDMPGSASVHTAVVEVLGLNREELRTLRYKVFIETRGLARIAASKTLELDLVAEARNLLLTKMDASAHFAAVARYVVRDVVGLGV
jgi:hypothetical protein